MSALLTVLLPLVLLSLTLTFLKTVRNGKKNGPYAPGPKPKPLIGNMLDMPSKDSAQVFIQWGKKYQSMSCRIFDASTTRLKKTQATFYLQALWEITYSL